jgi:GT2 family glycosyltransferase
VISIIIPVYGQLHLLLACLASIVKTATSVAELIIVDDCTPDFNLLNVPLPVAGKVVRLDKNGGFSQACNAGAQVATGDVLFFLNSDTEAHPNWQAPLEAAFTDPTVGIVGPKLLFPGNNWCPLCRVYYDKTAVVKKQTQDGKSYAVCLAHQDIQVEEVQTIQSCGGWFDAGKGPYHRYLGWRGDDWRVNKAEPVSWVTGAALAIRADVFKSAGGFDAAYGVGYFEDTDCCMRVKQAGWKIMYEPGSAFTHLVAQSTNNDKRTQQERALSFRANSRLFHLRWDAFVTIDTPWVKMVDY